MPTFDVVERDWNKAIEIVERDYPDVERGSPRFWALVFGVVKRMRGRKSSRHLDYLGVIRDVLGEEEYSRLRGILKEKLEKGRVDYLPYIVSPRKRPVSLSQLLVELPNELGEIPPSAYPSLPAARGQLYATANEILKSLGLISLSDRVNALLSIYCLYPVTIEAEVEECEVLRRTGVISLDWRRPLLDGKKWKLLWIYGLLNGKIPPPTRNWALFLSRLHPDEYRFLSNLINTELDGQPLKINWDEVENRGRIGVHQHYVYLVVKPTVAFSHRFLYMREKTGESGTSPEDQWEWLADTLGKMEPAALFYSVLLSSDDKDKIARQTLVLHPIRMVLEDFLCVVHSPSVTFVDYPLPTYEKEEFTPDLLAEILPDDEIENFASFVGGSLQPFHLGIVETPFSPSKKVKS